MEGRDGGGRRERNIDVKQTHQLVAYHTSPNMGLRIEPAPKYLPLTRNRTHEPFGVWAEALITEPHHPGLVYVFNWPVLSAVVTLCECSQKTVVFVLLWMIFLK